MEDGDWTKWLPRGEPVLLTRKLGTRTVTIRKDVTISENTERGGIAYQSLARPLDKYLWQDVITLHQFRAGNRLHSLWRYSILNSRYVRMNYGEIGAAVDLEKIALAPKEYMEAMRRISGEFERTMVYQVCCEELYAGRRKRLAALRSGLDDLVAHFKRMRHK